MDDGLVVGNVGAGVQPALRHGHGAQLAELVAAHQAAARDLAHGVAGTQPHEHLSVLEHLDPPAAHGEHLLGKRPRR